MFVINLIAFIIIIIMIEISSNHHCGEAQRKQYLLKMR